MGRGRVYGGGNPPSPGGYALPGQGDRSPPKQVVVRGLGHIESAPAVFGYFPPVESTAPQATHKTVTASARLFGVFTVSRCDGCSLNPTFLLCKRKVPLTVPKKTSRGCSESPLHPRNCHSLGEKPTVFSPAVEASPLFPLRETRGRGDGTGNGTERRTARIFYHIHLIF